MKPAISQRGYVPLILGGLLLLFLWYNLRPSGDSGDCAVGEPKSLFYQFQTKELSKIKKLQPIPGVPTGDKWIVVTTINGPTESTGALGKMTPKGWRTVVVADKKTPKDWKQEGVIFLTVEEQDKLGYAVNNVLGWNHYGRKNVGYLYAIQHGAKIIYETDDDNLLLQLAFPHMDVPHHGSLPRIAAANDSYAVNPYVYFGQPTVWPRGFPLEEMNKNLYCYTMYDPKPCNASVIQGLANKDPDVDAIFRLTRKLNFKFTDLPAVVIPTGTMSPFNSQNTLFYYEALWALMMPITITNRVTDIWRGYWCQRLLWDIGSNLVFDKASVIQHRNVHRIYKDFIEEDQLYKDAGRFVEFLRKWKSSKNSFFERVLELSFDMYHEKFWDWKDVELTKAWLEDLIAVGYQPPAVSGPWTPAISADEKHKTVCPETERNPCC